MKQRKAMTAELAENAEGRKSALGEGLRDSPKRRCGEVDTQPEVRRESTPSAFLCVLCALCGERFCLNQPR